MADGLQYAPPTPSLEIDQSKPAPVYDQSITPQAHAKLTSGRYSYHLAGAADINGHHSYIEDGKQNHARILGLRRRNFWILVALAVVLVGATIGGSIGGVLAVQNTASKFNTASLTPIDSTNSSSPSSTNTPYTFPPFSAIGIINIACPSPTMNSAAAAPLLRNLYTYNCLDNTNIGGVLDIASFTAYTLEQCVDACSQYNLKAKNDTCQAVVINEDVGFLHSTGNGANCWLKYNTKSFTGKGFTTAKAVVGGK